MSDIVLTVDESSTALAAALVDKRARLKDPLVELDGAEVEAIIAAALSLKVWVAARRAQISPPSADGSIVVMLENAITLADGESVRKSITVKPITLGDVRACTGVETDQLTGAFADRSIVPIGAYDRLLSQADAAAAGMAVDDALGKYLGNGQPS